MPKSPTVIHYCAECVVVEVSTSERAMCPICDGPMLKGAPPHGTYASMTVSAVHSVFARMMSDNGEVRGS
jgi:hypothetical protein